MGKYIINFEDNPGIAPDREKYYKCCEIPWWVATKSQLSELTPYTELDLDAIRKEAYAEGYKEGMQLSIDDAKLKEEYRRGLAEAWDAARKIGCPRTHSGFGIEINNEIFGTYDSAYILAEFSASEAIEKIRAYEQKQEGIKVGDEVIAPMGVAVITEITDECFHFIHADGSYGFDYKRDAPRKTGRHFPEIAEVLQKMKKMKEERA